MIWGCMHYGGLRPIRIIKGTVDSLKYREIIEECILSHSEEIKIFQQDNAPPDKDHHKHAAAGKAC